MNFLLSYLGKNFHLEADVGVPGEGDEEPGHDYHPWLHHLEKTVWHLPHTSLCQESNPNNNIIETNNNLMTRQDHLRG